MNKLLVTIYVPLLEEKYDVFIPNNKKINDIIVLAIKSIEQLASTNFILNENANLINKETGINYDLNKFVHETDIENSTELILI